MKKRTLWKSISIIQLSIVVFIIVFAISYISLRKLIFISDDDLHIGKEKMQVFAQKIRTDLIKNQNAKPFQCTTEDNKKIAGLIIERQNPVATLLYCHGYRCCKELSIGYIDMFPRCNAVLFDFRSHGENEKGVTTIGCHEYKDVLAVVKWIKEHRPTLSHTPFIIHGVSMGGAAALQAMDRLPDLCDGLIIDSSFSSLNTVIFNVFCKKVGLPTFPFFHIMSKMFDFFGSCDLHSMNPLTSIQKIKKPILLIHSCVDEVIPVQESLLMYAQTAQANSNSSIINGTKLWIAPKAKHGWIHKKYPELYKRKVSNFIEKKLLQRSSIN